MFKNQYFTSSDVSVIIGLPRVTANSHINCKGLRPTVLEASHRGVQHRYCFEDLCRYILFLRNLSKGMNKNDAAYDLTDFAFSEKQNYALVVESEDPSGKYVSRLVDLYENFPSYQKKENETEIRIIDLKFIKTQRSI